jgi:calcineurin-like phosphoesterase family protein
MDPPDGRSPADGPGHRGGATFRLLAIADEVDDSLGPSSLAEIRPDLVISCGDLPRDYLEYLVTLAGVPLLFVPGNHDPDYRERREDRPLVPLAGVGVVGGRGTFSPLAPPEPRRPSPPGGCTNVDARVVAVKGVVVAGLGGSVRYSEGPNQYTQDQMRRRALRLEARARLRRPRRGVDVLVTHSPPFGVGDQDDPAHRGFHAFHRLVARLSPRVLVHGHVHPYGGEAPDRWMGSTLVVNAVPHRVLDLPR